MTAGRRGSSLEDSGHGRPGRTKPELKQRSETTKTRGDGARRASSSERSSGLASEPLTAVSMPDKDRTVAVVTSTPQKCLAAQQVTTGDTSGLVAALAGLDDDFSEKATQPQPVDLATSRPGTSDIDVSSSFASLELPVFPGPFLQAEDLIATLPAGAFSEAAQVHPKFPMAPRKPTTRTMDPDSTATTSSDDSSVDTELAASFAVAAAVMQPWNMPKLWAASVRMPLAALPELWTKAVGNRKPSSEEATQFRLVVEAYRFSQGRTLRAAKQKLQELRLYM